MKTANFTAQTPTPAPTPTQKARYSDTSFFSGEIFSEVTFSQELLKLPHIKETTEIKFVISGEAQYLIENKSVSLKAGDILIIESFVIHSTIQGEAEILTISIQTEGEKRAKLLNPTDDGFLKISSVSSYSELNALQLIKVFVNEDAEYSVNILKGVAFLIVGLLENKGYIETEKEKPADYSVPNRIERVKQYVQSHFDEEITVAMAAKILGLHPGYFCRVFKKETGKTFVNYLNAYRIGQARKKLLKKGSNITEIMYETGFSNYGYFNRVFKQYTGCAPTEYRKRLGK